MKYLFTIIPLLICLACSETFVSEEYVVDPPVEQIDSLMPKILELNVTDITDHTISLSWNADNLSCYDLAVNDSVVCYDYTSSSYTFTDLIADSTYRLSVIAYDKNRNRDKLDVVSRTMKSYFAGALFCDLGYEEYLFENLNLSKNGDILACGLDRTYYGNTPFFLKLNASFEVDFILRQPDGAYGVDFVSAENDDFFALTKTVLTRIDNSGKELWSFKNPIIKDNSEFVALEVAANGDVFVLESKRTEWHLYKLSSAGDLQWSAPFTSAELYAPTDILLTTSGHIVLSGSCSYSTKNYYGLASKEHAAAVMWLDSEGAFMKKKAFPNKYKGSDIDVNFIPFSDDVFWIEMSATGNKPPNYYWCIEPRIIGFSAEGDSIFDNYYSDYGGYSVHITAFDVDEESNSVKVLTRNDNDNMYLLEMDYAGAVQTEQLFAKYPSCRLLDYFENGDFYMVSSYGQILFYHHDGYRK